MAFTITTDMNRETRSRIRCEERIAKRIIRDMLKAGYSISVNDGEETTLLKSKNLKAIIEAMFTTDEDYLLITKQGFKGWVRFIYGNDGWDVVNDYTTNLEPIMAPINEWSEGLQ